MNFIENDVLLKAKRIAAELEILIDPVLHKKAASNLRYINKTFSKLDELNAKSILSFSKHTVVICFAKLIKLFPLVFHDLGESCPRTVVKSYSQWASWLAFELSSHSAKQQHRILE